MRSTARSAIAALLPGACDYPGRTVTVTCDGVGDSIVWS